ncbi:hypothetical protein M3J09_000910 [Ascochyta lentis]
MLACSHVRKKEAFLNKNMFLESHLSHVLGIPRSGETLGLGIGQALSSLRVVSRSFQLPTTITVFGHEVTVLPFLVDHK